MATRTPGLQSRSQYGSYWGQYASAAALPNASGNPLANPYFAQLEAGDIAFVTGGTLYVCTSAGTLGGADAAWSAVGGGGSGTLWAWNETDTSQFQISLDTIGSGGAALSVVQKDWGPALRVTWPTKTTGLQATFITITDPGITKLTGDRYRYTQNFRLCGFSGTASEWYCVGPSFLCNKQTGAGFYGLAIGGDANSFSRYARVQAGTLALSSATPSWITDALTPVFDEINTAFRNAVVAKHVAASPPGFQNFCYGRKSSQSGGVDVIAGVNNTYYVNQIAAFGAGWGAETLDTCGIFILGATGTTAGQWMEFDLMSIVRDPADQ